MNAVANRNPVIIVNMRVCPLTPGDNSSLIELGSQNRVFCSGKAKGLFSLDWTSHGSMVVGLIIRAIPAHGTVRNDAYPTSALGIPDSSAL